MEVKIGVTQGTRELSLDSNLDGDAIEEKVRTALSEGGVLTLADAKGRRVVVPVEKLAYVEIATSAVGPVGFRS